MANRLTQETLIVHINLVVSPSINYIANETTLARIISLILSNV